jgi:hypothetical protein
MKANILVIGLVIIASLSIMLSGCSKGLAGDAKRVPLSVSEASSYSTTSTTSARTVYVNYPTTTSERYPVSVVCQWTHSTSYKFTSNWYKPYGILNLPPGSTARFEPSGIFCSPAVTGYDFGRVSDIKCAFDGSMNVDRWSQVITDSQGDTQQSIVNQYQCKGPTVIISGLGCCKTGFGCYDGAPGAFCDSITGSTHEFYSNSQCSSISACTTGSVPPSDGGTYDGGVYGGGYGYGSSSYAFLPSPRIGDVMPPPMWQNPFLVSALIAMLGIGVFIAYAPKKVDA